MRMQKCRFERGLLLALLLICVSPQPAVGDVGKDAQALAGQLNPINVALGPLIDRAISDGNDALAQRLEQLRSIIQEALFNVNKIISDATININSDAAGRLADLNGYVQVNLATFKGIADGSIDALNENAKQRIDQLSNNAANLVMALPIPAQPLPNVPNNGYSIVKASGASTPLFITGAGLLRGGKHPRAYILNLDSPADKHFFSHDGTEVPVSAASMGLIELQIPASVFPKDPQAERTLVLLLNAGAIFEKAVEPSFPLLLCSVLPKYTAKTAEEAYGQIWETRIVPHPKQTSAGQLYIDSGSDGGTDARRHVCANASDEGAGGWNADPNAGYHGLQYDIYGQEKGERHPGLEHIGSFADDGKGCIDMYAARDSSGGGWAKMTGLAIHQRKLKKSQCGDTFTPPALALDYSKPAFIERNPQELLDKCAQLSEGAADKPNVVYRVDIIDQQQTVVGHADLGLGTSQRLVNNTISAEVNNSGTLMLTIASRCLRSQ
jgi:hypothetical protein